MNSSRAVKLARYPECSLFVRVYVWWWSGRLYVCIVNLFLYLIPFTFSFSPLSMPLNRVIVPTVRQAAECVCVCSCALLLQGADSREVCLNREGAQRLCSSCRVWNWMIGPPFSLSICPSVYLSVSLPLWQFFSHMLDPHLRLAQFYCTSLFSFFVCVSEYVCECLCMLPCNVSALGSPHWSAVF